MTVNADVTVTVIMTVYTYTHNTETHTHNAYVHVCTHIHTLHHTKYTSCESHRHSHVQ